MAKQSTWTVYLCQDKHLDYNWCGTTTQIELRMVALLDYYLSQAEAHGGRWNLDGTLWVDVYGRHRGDSGRQRLLRAIGQGLIGYAANHSVQLWGMMSTETAVRALLGSREIEEMTGRPARTCLLMENWGVPWGVAGILTDCGVTRLARGTYPLRAEAYHGLRAPWPLFWWEAPNGKRLLVHWPPYSDTKSWGGYAEAFDLAALAGETWDAFRVRTVADRNSPEVFAQRCAFIGETVRRYASLGAGYPVRSIMLLGTGWDNWTCTDDFRLFVERFNAASDGRIRLVDARYDEFFAAVEEEIAARRLTLPALRGSFGITWEEWPAHLADLTRDFREAERLLRQGEAVAALRGLTDDWQREAEAMLHQGNDAVMRFLEHDVGGCRRHWASVSAGVRAAAATEALDIGTALAPRPRRCGPGEVPVPIGSWTAERTDFDWHGRTVRFAPDRFAVASIATPEGDELVGGDTGSGHLRPLLGELLVTRFPDAPQRATVFPPAVPFPRQGGAELVVCRRCRNGVDVRIEGWNWGFRCATQWFFHASDPWIDLVHRFGGGWDEQARTVQVCFPAAMDHPSYRYDTAGAVLRAGSQPQGGDDLPGANPTLFAAQSFAGATGRDRQLLLVTPDAYLVEFGGAAVRATGYDGSETSCLIASMPLMNLTRQDRQLGQAGRQEWTFRYRIVLDAGPWDPLAALRQAQQFGTPPFLWTAGVEPAIPEIARLDVLYDGGPLVAVKRAQDGQRLILRFCNLLDTTVPGSLRLPEQYVRGESCDGLERPLGPLATEGGRLTFEVPARALATLALCRS